MFNTFEQECEIKLLENMMFTLFYCENFRNNYLYDKIKTSYNLLSEKYPNTMIKVYSTNQLGCFKGCIKTDMIEICIIPTDFVNYKISELQLQNIMCRMMMTRNMTI